ITGRPLWVNAELNASDAFMVIWQPGTEGAGVAEVIFKTATGDIAHDVKGRLTFSWPKRPDQGPLNIGDENYDPLFPYGYGLSYGDTDKLANNLSEEGMMKEETFDVLEIFNRRPMAPWQIELEGGKNDRAVMSGNVASVSTLTATVVDREVQEDARRVVWAGTGTGLIALSTKNRQVLIDYLNQDGALIFGLKDDKGYTKDVILRIGCGSSCNADLTITRMITPIAGKGWHTLVEDLSSCPYVGCDF